MDKSIPYLSNTERFRPNITPVPNRLARKVAIVTGGARGIGEAIAVRFAQEGAAVVVADKDLEPALEVVSELQSLGVQAIAVEVNVVERTAVDEMIGATLRRFGRLDIVVNNAGIVVFGSLMQCTVKDWERILAVDLTGAFHCTQAAAREMMKQGQGGRFIHIGSTASLLPAPLQGAYSVAKAGLLMMSRAAAIELARHQITSNLVCPHGAITDMNRELLSEGDVMRQLETHIPSGRVAKVEEIAAAVAFLASDEAVYITGTELIHDGAASISALWWR